MNLFNVSDIMDLSLIGQCVDALTPYALSVSLGVSVSDLMIVLIKDPALVISYMNGVIGYDRSFVVSRIQVIINIFPLCN